MSQSHSGTYNGHGHGHDRMVGEFMQSMPITTKVVNSNPADGRVYSIQTLRDKNLSATFLFVAGRWFSPVTPVSSTNKTDSHDIAEILLKVALNTIPLTLPPFFSEMMIMPALY